MRTLAHGRTVAVAGVLALAITSCGSDSGSESGAAKSNSGVAAKATPAGEDKITQATIDFGVKFTGGTAAKADESLAPVVIGYSNQQGGTTSFAEYDHSTGASVKFINEHLGGIDGHPLKLDKCVIQTEEDGQKCAAQFIASKVPVVNASLAVVGNKSMYETLGGKIPVIVSQGSNPADPGASHVYELDGGAYAVITAMAVDIQKMGAKKVAMLAADNPSGRNIVDNLIAPPLKEAGIDLKPVYTSPTATTPDFVSAAQAAGAATADVIVSIPISPGQCVQTYDAFKQLGLLKKPIISTISSCTGDPVVERTGGGPEGWHLFGQGLTARVVNEETSVYRNVMTAYGEEEFMFTQQTFKSLNDLMTIAKFGNELGFDGITPAAVEEKLLAFAGPAYMVPGAIKCGHHPIPTLQAVCGDSAAGVTFKDGKWQSLGGFKAVDFK
jgi:branched-chain amino acid transport system substrate-binding protein